MQTVYGAASVIANHSAQVHLAAKRNGLQHQVVYGPVGASEAAHVWPRICAVRLEALAAVPSRGGPSVSIGAQSLVPSQSQAL